MFTLKLIGGVLLSFSGWYGGMLFCHRYTIRRMTLNEMIRLLKTLEEEIAFRRSNLNILYDLMVKEKKFPLLGFSQTAASVINDFNTSSGAFQKLVPPTCFNREEKEMFRDCFASLGHACAAQECERLVRYCKQFELFYQKAWQKEQQSLAIDCKIGLAIGSMFAFALL